MDRKLLILIILTLVTVVAPVARQATAAERVSVWLDSGRTLTGEIDPRSSDSQLWLRRGDDQANLTRAIAWQRIVKAERHEKPISLDELRGMAKEVAAAPAVTPALPAWRGVFAASAPSVAEPPTAEPVRSLAIDAFHANWDQDVESDGLVVVVYPLDDYGQWTAVTGTLEVEVLAPEVRRFQDAPQGRGLTLERIARWSVALHPQDFAVGGARVRLPFQAQHPEFDAEVLPHGLVHARLTVPGQGTFDASVDFVRMRPWTPLRDQLWRDTGRRFLPTEQTGRAPRID